MKVLLLDSDPNQSNSIARALDQAGHTVTQTAEISGAMSLIRHLAPDLLILSLLVGNQFSMSVADYAAFAFPSAEVVFMTDSRLFPHGELHRMAANVSWVMRDPDDVAALVSVVSHLQASRGAQPALVAS